MVHVSKLERDSRFTSPGMWQTLCRWVGSYWRPESTAIFSFFIWHKSLGTPLRKPSNVALRTNFQPCRPDVTANLVSAGDLPGSAVNIGNYTNRNVVYHHFTILTKIVNILQRRFKLCFFPCIGISEHEDGRKNCHFSVNGGSQNSFRQCYNPLR